MRQKIKIKYLGGHRKNISHAATSLGDILCAISEDGEKKCVEAIKPPIGRKP